MADFTVLSTLYRSTAAIDHSQDTSTTGAMTTNQRTFSSLRSLSGLPWPLHTCKAITAYFMHWTNAFLAQ